MKLSPEMQELFERDPMKISDQDVDKIIEEMRRHRANFAATSKLPGKKAPSKTKVPSAAPADLLKKLDMQIKGKD